MTRTIPQSAGGENRDWGARQREFRIGKQHLVTSREKNSERDTPTRYYQKLNNPSNPAQRDRSMSTGVGENNDFMGIVKRERASTGGNEGGGTRSIFSTRAGARSSIGGIFMKTRKNGLEKGRSRASASRGSRATSCSQGGNRDRCGANGDERIQTNSQDWVIPEEKENCNDMDSLACCPGYAVQSARSGKRQDITSIHGC